MDVALLFVGRVQHYYAQSYQAQIYQSLRCQGFRHIDVFLSHNGHNTHDPLQDFVRDYGVTTYESKAINMSMFNNIPIPTREGVYNYNSLVMFYHLHNAFQLCKTYGTTHQRNYKAVIYLRADAEYADPLILPQTFHPNTIYIPTIPTQTYINDQCAYGPPEVMERLCSLYTYLEDYTLEQKISIVPETLYAHHINTVNLQVKPITLRYSLNPNRRHNTWFIHENARKPT